MDFDTKADIEAPLAWVFKQATDFAAFERQAMRRGADVQRVDRLDHPGPGSAWDVQFRFRGRDRLVNVRLTRFDPPNGYDVDMDSANLHGTMQVELVALSRVRTRLAVRLALDARSLQARILLQSLRLARGQIARRFDTRMAAFALDLQNRYARRPGATAGARPGE